MCETAVKTPDSQGTYADYVELLKLYDKNSNGTMMLAELDNILCNLGDEIPTLMYKRCSLRSVILRTKTVCSPTCLSLTGSLERPKYTSFQVCCIKIILRFVTKKQSGHQGYLEES